MEVLEAILAALKTQSAGNILTLAGMYIASPLCVSLWIQGWKKSRKRAGRPLSAWTLRAAASAGTFIVSGWIGWRLGKWPLGDAADHALAIAVMYPLATIIYFNWLERHQPTLADDLGYDGASTELTGDKTDAPK